MLGNAWTRLEVRGEPMIVIGNMLGVAPEDRAELLRWSDDMLKALGSPDPGAGDTATETHIEVKEQPLWVGERNR